MAKRGPKPTSPIDTHELCSHGCGQVAKFKNESGKLLCEKSSNACPVIRKRNSRGLQIKHAEFKELTGNASFYDYRDISDDSKDNMKWNKGNNSAVFEYGGKGDHKPVVIREKGYSCEICGISSWLGESITLEMDHIDGDRKNNAIENLRLLCPNCHAQTPTWRGRNSKTRGKKKHTEETILQAIKTCENLNQVLDKLDLRWGSARTIYKVIEKHRIFFGNDIVGETGIEPARPKPPTPKDGVST